MKITTETKLKSGTYRFASSENGIVQISGRGFVVDCAGVKLRGADKNAGIGIVIRDARDVTLKNANVRGMRWGIVIERCANVRLENCKSSENANLPLGTVIDESGREAEDQHGGGMLIRDSHKCRVVKCEAKYQWDGIDVVRSDENVIENGDFSYNNNWGVHFWNSSRNTFEGNRAIWCTTGASLLYQSLSGWQTYDAQAVAIDHNSHENRIEGNDLRFGGDGIFIRANEGALYPETGVMTPVRNGSHRNILKNNDCSFSPNNAIEVDFVDDTVIEGNNCSNSNYGMWLGYSRRSMITKNVILNCSSKAIEIENGQYGVFEENVLGGSPDKPMQALIYLRQNGRDKTPSGGYVIRRNHFTAAGQAILLRNTGAIVQDNSLMQMKNNKAVTADGGSQVRETGTQILTVGEPNPTLKKIQELQTVWNKRTTDKSCIPQVAKVEPSMAKAGDKVRIVGIGLSGGRVFVNGVVAEIEKASPEEITVRIPAEFTKKMPVHVVVRVGEDDSLMQSAPVVLQIQP